MAKLDQEKVTRNERARERAEQREDHFLTEKQRQMAQQRRGGMKWRCPICGNDELVSEEAVAHLTGHFADATICENGSFVSKARKGTSSEIFWIHHEGREIGWQGDGKCDPKRKNCPMCLQPIEPGPESVKKCVRLDWSKVDFEEDKDGEQLTFKFGSRQRVVRFHIAVGARALSPPVRPAAQNPKMIAGVQPSRNAPNSGKGRTGTKPAVPQQTSAQKSGSRPKVSRSAKAASDGTRVAKRQALAGGAKAPQSGNGASKMSPVEDGQKWNCRYCGEEFPTSKAKQQHRDKPPKKCMKIKLGQD